MVKHNTEEFFKKTGNNIAAARKAIGLTQEQLCEKIGLSQSVLASYEIGRRRIPIPTLIKIAESLNVYVDDLLPIEQDKKKRGPIPKIDRKLSKVKLLPEKDQKLVLNLIDTILRNNSFAS